MKIANLKLADLVIQLLALLIPMVLHGIMFTVLTGWMALGAAQTLSCGINYVLLKKKDRARSRRIYEFFSLTFVISILGYWLTSKEHEFELLRNSCQAVAMTMMVLSPGLAAWYFIITGHEISKARNQPL